jgi:hypothetical protein
MTSSKSLNLAKTASDTFAEKMKKLATSKTTSSAITVVWMATKKMQRLINGSNSRANPMAKSAIADAQRQGILLRLASLLLKTEVPPPWNVRITRLGPRSLDEDDNLNISAKHIRDGIADALGVNDGDKTKISFSYAQEKSQQYGVRVEISSRPV